MLIYEQEDALKMLLLHAQIPIPEDENADIEIYKENGMVYLKVGGKVVPTDVPAEGEYLKPDGSVKMTGNLQLNGNAIMGVKSISNTNSGMALESEVSLNNHKITDLLDPTEDQDAATKKYVDERSVLGPDGKIDSELDMNEHAIVNAHKISTDGPAPLYIGATIEDEGNNAPRLTATSQGEAAFVKASTQSTYVPVMVATPTQANHAANKSYVDTSLSGRVPTSRKVSGKALTADIVLTAADVGALADTVTIPTKTSQLTNDSNFIPTTGGTFTGAVSCSVAPADDNNLTNKTYVDGRVQAIQASALLKSGGTMSGDLTLKGNPTTANMAATKAYVDALLPAFTAADNDKVLGIVDGALAWVAKA